MINNYELLILNYIFNALHDFNSHHSINIGAVGLINLKWNRKVSVPSAAGDLTGLHGEGPPSLYSLYCGIRAGMALWGGWEESKPGCEQQQGVEEPTAALFQGESVREEHHRRAGSTHPASQVDENQQKSSLSCCIPNPHLQNTGTSITKTLWVPPSSSSHLSPPSAGARKLLQVCLASKLPLSVTIALAAQRGFTGLLLSL